jgi:hypothetical protein
MSTPMTEDEELSLRRVGEDAALLSLVEIGLGSLLHGLKIPLTGQFLSLNQGFLLARATLRQHGLPADRFTPARVSNVASLLKSLSPAGKKLTPMLAIAAQGLLFNIGTLLLGTGRAGLVLGSVIASLWAFAQPLLIYLLIFGRTLWDVAEYHREKLQELLAFDPARLLWVIAGVALAKALAAAVLAVWATTGHEESFRAYDARLKAWASKVAAQRKDPPVGEAAWKGALRDLCSPIFLLSLALTAAYFVLAESDHAGLAWGLLRPLSVAYALFWLLRAVSLEGVTRRLERAGMSRLAYALRVAIRQVKRDHDPRSSL